MSRIVRQSKYRHVFGTPAKQELCYIGTKATKTAWDSNLCACSTKNIALSWESSGGGIFAVIPYEKTGKIGEIPLVTGHKAAVLDLDWNPFNENLIASASEDCNVMIWNIPDEGLKESLSTPVQTLSGHKRKVGAIKFHPCANNILSSIGADFQLKIWDIEKGEEMFNAGEHTDVSASVSWNKNGSLICTSCKDKKLRIFDPRQQKCVKEFTAHTGSKGFRSIWLADKDKIVTAGLSRNADREYALWDPNSSSEEPLTRATYDNSNGSLMSFYDQDSSIIFFAGKGDGSIRYYEVVDEKPYLHLLSDYKSGQPQSGMGMLPKRAINVSACEIARLYKVMRDRIEPISFNVPRKSDIFQEDLFPKCYAGISTLSADEWKNGENKDPDNSFDLSPGFVQPERKVEEFNPVQKEAEKPKDMKEELDELKKKLNNLEEELKRKDEIIESLKAEQRQ